jgi:hypothetical protein
MSEENLFWVFNNSGTFFELEQSKEDNKFRQTKWVRWNNFHNRVSVVEEKRPYSLFCLEKNMALYDSLEEAVDGYVYSLKIESGRISDRLVKAGKFKHSVQERYDQGEY